MIRTYLVLLLFLAPPASGQDAETTMQVEAWRVETLEQRFDVPPDTAIRLANSFGELLVQGVDETSEMVAYAAVQHHMDDPRRPRLAVSEESGVFELKVEYPEDRASPPDAWRKRRIDLTVHVPRNSRLHVETLHGRGRVRDFQAPIEALSESGDIEIRSSGPVTAKSHHGKVWLRVLGENIAPHSLETVTGEIRLDVPWGARFQANIETRGEIASDFSVDIAWLEGSHIKRGTVRVQERGPTLDLRSDRGNVRLLRKMRPPRH